MKNCTNEIIFLNNKHQEAFYLFLNQACVQDCYTRSLLYLLAMDDGTRAHITSLYSFEENRIKFDGLYEGWQTHSSNDICRLAFNLFNGFCGGKWKNGEWVESDYPAEYTPHGLFHREEYQLYYFQAIQLRYPIHHFSASSLCP